MSGCGCQQQALQAQSAAYRRALTIVLAINAMMFLVEMAAGAYAGSQALKADALDFLGDTATYGLTLWVIGRSDRLRAGAARIKGVSLAMMGILILGATAYRSMDGGAPEDVVMGTVGLVALVANLLSALILLRHKDGDANMRSVWLCSRNDAIGNVAVIVAGVAVWATSSAWPDLLVAAAIASLFLHSSFQIIRQARGEWRMATKALAAAE